MKQRIKNYFLRYLFCVVLPQDIIQTDKTGTIFIGGKKITENELRQLQAESKALEGFRIWGLMTNSVRYQAQDKMFNKSTDFEHVMTGKTMLLNLDTIEGIARVFRVKPRQ